MKAVGKHIVINPDKDIETTTKGGLLLAEAHREDIRYRKATVMTVGPLVAGVEPDDNIYYDRHAGFTIEINKDQYKVIKEQDVVVIL
jgi:co-chaperonin GroES (HSP10)